MERKIKDKVVFPELRKIYKKEYLRFKEIKNLDLEDEDIIISEWVGEDSDTDWCSPGHYRIQIIREELETDEEFQLRLNEQKKQQAEFKKRQYETFLKLKKEFEPNGTDINSENL